MAPMAEARKLEEPSSCFHCGEPVPPGVCLEVDIEGIARPMCCPGCQAVAGLIAAGGLDGFYRKRTVYSERPREAPGEVEDHFDVYDDPELAATFTTCDEEGRLTASILVGGISCAACVWLIEQSSGALPGVSSAAANLQRARLDIRFDPQQGRLSDIFRHLEQLGYRPRPFQTSLAQQQALQERRDDLKRLGVAGLGMMQVGMFAIALHAGDLQGIEPEYQSLLRWVSLLVTGFVVTYSARPFFISAWRHLRQGSLVMDLPVSLAIGMAFAASAWATVAGTGQVYFDSAVMFIFLLLLGRFLEQRVRHGQLLNWVDAENSLPDAVTVRHDDNWQTVPRAALRPGETILVRAGDTVPVDARLCEGSSAVREDTFNGEHRPRDVAVNDTIYAGTLNVGEVVQAVVLTDYRDSRLAALQRSVERAQVHKPQLARLADRIASWFIGAVLLAAAVTGLTWLYLDPANAFWITLSVLMVSCPCALALATPSALTGAANGLRARGVLVRGEDALESLPRCTHLVLDKTGTLTDSTPSVSRVEALGSIQAREILALAAALQTYSNHPLSAAFANIEGTPGFQRVNYRVGAGLEADREGATYRVGSATFCRELAADFPEQPDSELSWIGVCREEEPLGWIGLDEHVRPEAKDLVDHAKGLGLQVELLTGDSSGRGQRLAQSLGIEQVATGQSPQQKMAYVERLQQEGATVAMVGDGLNDAPVLALADTSFAVAGATDLARSQADFLIVDDDLDRITETLQKARQCRAVVRQNLGWALAYNLCAMPLAALGYVPPWAAAIGMSLSSLLVVTNSLRLSARTGLKE